MKKTLSLDFDGVCHSYTSPWQGPTVIPDPPVPGLFDFLVSCQEDFVVEIYSTRSETLEGREAMKKWFEQEAYKLVYARNLDYEDNALLRAAVEALRFPSTKPKAFVGLDDRIITFTGKWPPVDFLKKFKPWNKRGKDGDAGSKVSGNEGPTGGPSQSALSGAASSDVDRG